MQRQATAPARVRLVAPIRVAIYARVSSDQQAERHTIESQVQALLAHAAVDGHEIAPELRFLDDRHSGASLIRPALERLRDFAAMGAIDLVYVHAPDRLARSYAHQAVLVEEFARAGAEVVFLNRPIGQTPEDTLLLQLQGMFTEYERARIAERSRRGKRHRAQAGSVSVLSRAPYGYRYVGREAGGGAAHFEVAETEAEVVRRIFRWIGEKRVSLSAVCRRLFEAGVPSPTGKAQWGRSMIWTLLSSSAYTGQARVGKTAAAPWRPPLRPARGRAPVPKRLSRRVPAPPEHHVAIPIPPLVDAALFEGVQEQLDENRRRRRQRVAGALSVARLAGLPGMRPRVLRFLAKELPAPAGAWVPLLPLHRGAERPRRWPASVRRPGHPGRAPRRGSLARGPPTARRPGPRHRRIPAPPAGRAHRASPARAGDG